MSFLDLQRAILDRELCASCGGCAAVCPERLIEFSGDVLPTLADPTADLPQSCLDCTLCLDICPGEDTGTAASEHRMFGRRRAADERWTGIVRGTYSVVCRDPRVLERAASGGAGTGILLAALRSGMVDAVLVMGRGGGRDWAPRAVLTADEETVVRAAQSSYSLAPNLQLLRDERFQRLGIVGLPCEIQALGKMRNLVEPPPVASKVSFTLELACSSSTRLAGTTSVLRQELGLDPDEVAEVHYRDGAYPGEFAAVTAQGERHTLPFFRAVQVFRDFKTHRCMGCPDWWSGLADISICDGDPNIFATSAAGGGRKPRSIVAVRTAVGEEVLARAAAGGLLEVEPGELEIDVNLGLQRKRHRYARLRADGKRPIPAPPVEDPDEVPLLSDDELTERLSGIGLHDTAGEVAD
jgi:coenzyme F420 hydrogenase subunit beta